MTAPLAPRVLVIDNDPRICELLTFNLSRRGYQVHAVNGNGPELLDQAIVQANAYRPHVAIVDLRLIDDFVDDRSGLDLLPHLRSARCILFSAYLVSDVTLQAAREHNAFAWVDKYRPDDLYQAVQRAAEEACATTRGITIHWPASWPRTEMVRRLFGDSTAPPHLSIFDDMIAQLFVENRTFFPETVSGAVNGLISVVRGRSAVIKIYPDEFEPKILKLGNAARIHQEEACYRLYIKDQLPSLHATRLEKSVAFWDLGGATYTFIGSSNELLPTFSQYYATTTAPQALAKPLAHFFKVVWRQHYAQMKPADFPTLFAAYDEVFALTERLSLIDPARFAEVERLVPIPLTNPVDWVARFGRDSIIRSARQAVTHGDLHGDNLFVDDNRAWVIDFERTGPGHALRDFVELETDIYTRLAAEAYLDWPSLLELALVLVQPTNPTTALEPTALISTNAEAQKALAVIQEIRRLAVELVHYSDQREYLWAILFDALFLASLPSAAPSQQLRALLLSAIICERLRTWGEAWPPVAWQ